MLNCIAMFNLQFFRPTRFAKAIRHKLNTELYICRLNYGGNIYDYFTFILALNKHGSCILQST